MTNAELIAKIKAEVERLKDENNNIRCDSNKAYCQGYGDAFVDLLPFLNTFESEKPVPNDLEEASSKFATHTASNGVSVEFLEEKLSFQEGAKWDREQMMKEAVEGIAHPDDCEIWVDLIGYGFNIKDGDKVRVIVLPKEN